MGCGEVGGGQVRSPRRNALGRLTSAQRSPYYLLLTIYGLLITSRSAIAWRIAVTCGAAVASSRDGRGRLLSSSDGLLVLSSK